MPIEHLTYEELRGISQERSPHASARRSEEHWYLSTSDSQGRKSYKLLVDELACVPVCSFVQESGLEWQHEGRTGGQSILSQESHLALARHNYSNVG